jgi:corrinoid protein of di/trimethylamine methyltransferase
LGSKLTKEKEMDPENLSERLGTQVTEGQEEDAEKTAREIVNAGADPLEVIEKYLSPAMRFVGEKFEKGEYFLTDLMSAAAAMKAATRILVAAIRKEDRERMQARKLGRVVIGTVSGDIHDIGKNIVTLLLDANGFDTNDLGKDVDSINFIEKAKDFEADLIALSALMTTTKPAQKEVIDFLKAMSLREKYAVVVGGSPTTKDWADQIGADGWAETAEQAVRLAEELLQRRRPL